MYDLVVLDAHERDAAKTAIVVKDAVHAIMCHRDQLDGPGADAGIVSIGVLRVAGSLVSRFNLFISSSGDVRLPQWQRAELLCHNI